jgi:hypothetical protein
MSINYNKDIPYLKELSLFFKLMKINKRQYGWTVIDESQKIGNIAEHNETYKKLRKAHPKHILKIDRWGKLHYDFKNFFK